MTDDEKWCDSISETGHQKPRRTIPDILAHLGYNGQKNIPPIFTTATKSVGYDHKQHALQCLSATFATPINTNPLASPANADKMTNLDHKVAKMLHGLRIQVGVMDSHAIASCEVRTHAA